MRYRRAVRSVLAFALLVGLSACGGASGAKASVAAATTKEPPRAPRKVVLSYEISGRKFPLPLAHVVVAGEHTLALVDTGANTPVIAGWLARKVGLTTLALGDTGTDHAGRTISTRRAPHPAVSVDGWGDLPDEPMLVADVPEAFTKLGIGLFLSPQQLATADARVVLDLAAGELREMPASDSLDELSRGATALTTEKARACIDEDSAVGVRMFVVAAKIESTPVELLLDSGAQHTDLIQTLPPGKALLPKSVPSREQPYVASGKLTARTIKGAAVDVGDVHTTVDVDLIPGKGDPFCARDGVLAMDILGHCVLAFEPDDVHVFCKP